METRITDITKKRIITFLLLVFEKQKIRYYEKLKLMGAKFV